MITSQLSDEELLVQYGKGHLEAFDVFYKRNSKMIFLFIMSRVGDQGEAEDILQECFIRIHKYIHRYDPNKKSLNWILTIAKNLILTHFAKRRNHTSLDESSLAERKTSSIEARESLAEIMLVLKDDEKSLLIDKYVNEESYEEISLRNGLTTSNNRQKLCRIMKKLRLQKS